LKKIVRYREGDEIPRDAVFLCTETIYVRVNKSMSPPEEKLVFIYEVPEAKKKAIKKPKGI